MKFKKLIPALAMLLVAAVLMGTSTFAWFSMNTEVTATGMEITVNSDSVYLLIDTKEAYDTRETASAGTGLSGIQDNAASHLAVTLTGEDNNLFPSAWKQASTPVTDTSSTALGLTDTTGTSGVGSDIADPTNWYKATAATVTAAAAEADSGANLTAFTNYVQVYNYKLTLAVGSNPVAVERLKVNYTASMTNVKSGSAETFAAVRTLVVVGDNFEEFSGASGSGTVGLNAAQLTDQAAIDVTVYVYYDGNDSSVYTNNIANLEGAVINLEFTVA